MNLKKILTPLILLATLLAGPQSLKATLTGEWRVYPSFDKYTTQVMDTPETVYFSAQAQEYIATYTNLNEKLCSLFAFDKKSKEMVALTSKNKLTRDMILRMAYNPYGKYLVAVCDNMEVNILYDNGDTSNIAALANATLPGNKAIHNISFDPNGSDIFISTEFGYIRLDGKKCQVVESRIYNTPVYDTQRVGNRIVLLTDTAILAAFESSPRYTISEYTAHDGFTDKPLYILPVDNDSFIGILGRGLTYSYPIRKYVFAENDTRLDDDKRVYLDVGRVLDIQYVADGWILRMPALMYKFDKSCKGTKFLLQSEDYYKIVATTDMKTLWRTEPQVGLSCISSEDGKTWTVEMEPVRPNSPAPFNSYNTEYSPKYGLIVGSHGYERRFSDSFSFNDPNLISGFKEGFWTDYSPVSHNASASVMGTNFLGLAIDPVYPNYVYRGSLFNGLMRVNLDDPTETLQITRENHGNANGENAVAYFPAQKSWNALCGVKYPQFDNDGNLLFIYGNYNNNVVELYRWSKEQRKVVTGKESFVPFDVTKLPFKPTNLDIFLVLKHKNNSTKVVVAQGDSKAIQVIDHKGTFDNASDDRIVALDKPLNQDGAQMSTYNINTMFEDPASGLVWVGNEYGLFTFNPSTVYTNPVVNQIKVSRNDGTDLADYLLNNVAVCQITEDGQGRKWISTGGAGIVVTSNDGKKIIDEIKEDNSFLPSNTVNSCTYNPETGSMLISTTRGFAEFSPSGFGSSSNEAQGLRAYPNPVEPDYYGYVTIDNMPDNSLVKIMDAQGNLVRDLGIAETGSIQWDVMGLDYKRVKTGVYYVFASGTTDTESYGLVGKILVMN